MPFLQAAAYMFTSGASITVMTTAGFFCGGFIYASAAAANINVVDGTNSLLRWSGNAGVSLAFDVTSPVAVDTNLTVTASGPANYVIFYVQQ